MSYTEECEASVSHQTEGMRMNSKVIALAVVGIMLSVCLVGAINYADDADANAITGKGTSDNPYILPSVELSELKDKAVVYFNLSYDEQFVSTNPEVKIDIKYTTDGEYDGYLSGSDGTLENYRYSNVLTATKFDADVEATVKYVVKINYDNLPAATVGKNLTETVYYQVSVSIHKATDDLNISMEFQSNVAYDGRWILNDNVYKVNEDVNAVVAAIFTKENASFYSNDLPAGLYLKKVGNTGATIVGMLGSSETSDGTFHVYTITDTEVLVTEVTYTVKGAAEGSGFTYSVRDGSVEIIKDASDKTVLVKSGTDLTITTSVNLTELKVTNATNGDAYNVVSDIDNPKTYKIDGSTLSGTIKVFMTYNNGINDHRTIELTIIYIGSFADASLVDPVVRSY